MSHLSILDLTELSVCLAHWHFEIGYWHWAVNMTIVVDWKKILYRRHVANQYYFIINCNKHIFSIIYVRRWLGRLTGSAFPKSHNPLRGANSQWIKAYIMKFWTKVLFTEGHRVLTINKVIQITGVLVHKITLFIVNTLC